MRIESHIDQNNLDVETFEENLLAETALLKRWFDEKYFVEEELESGSEIEFIILDEDHSPSPRNLEFIAELGDAGLVPEVGCAQLEINSSHYALSGNCLSLLHQNILQLWQRSCEIANKNHCHLAMLGSMPMAEDIHHQAEYMTNTKRLSVISDYLEANHTAMPCSIAMHGYDESLEMTPGSSLAITGLLSAFQLHLKVGLAQSVRFYNATQVIAAPMLALCCNSPFFYGQKLWSESRVGIFEQLSTVTHATCLEGIQTAVFGEDYLRTSFFDLFHQNWRDYPRAVPEVSPHSSTELMFHVRAQNSTIYRWNRPIIDFNENGQPHLRIEHRGPSVGPTVLDMIANAAFFYGIVHYFATQTTPVETLLPFRHVKKNFYSAARSGFSAKLMWFDDRTLSARELIGELIPLARWGLLQLGIDTADAEYYLSIIERRVVLGQNGSAWQQSFVQKYGKDFHGMLDSLLYHQQQEIPVSDWTFKG